MSLNRREFVKVSAMAGAALLLARQKAWAAFAQSPALRKFVAPMRGFGAEIPVMTPNTRRYPGVDYYRIAMRQFRDKLHPSLPPTTLYGYGDPFSAFRHLGGAIVAQKDRPVRITWMNHLPDTHILPMDMSTIAPYGIPAGLEANRAAPHLHGGLVPWPSDGGPYHWFSSAAGFRPPVVGPSVVNWLPVNGPFGHPIVGPKGRPLLNDDYYYPNIQSARLMWYHDHAVGITRLNAYAGLATGYILTDAAEAILMNDLRIPADRHIPIVFQDKVFTPDGDLWYPTTYDTDFFDLEPGGQALPTPSLVPEFWGDTILANGTAYPYLKVEPRRYRFRILNACNTRFLNLSLVLAAGRTFPDNAEPSALLGPEMRLIGTEGGFLDGSLPAVEQGVRYNVPGAPPLLLAPAERADLIVDFSAMQPGQTLILHSDAPVPFPGGPPQADFCPGNPDLVTPPDPGFSPNTRTLLQFRVVARGVITGDGKPDPKPARWSLPPSPMPALPPSGTPARELALYETVDAYGRLAQNLGPLGGALGYNDPPTEVCQAGTVEIWKIFNLSADTHPIHFHYFNVRVLSRQATQFEGSTTPTGDPYPPEPGELGWKETVRMNPVECITLLVEVPPTTGLAPAGVTIPDSPRLAKVGTPGAEYVWHCHILEHEEHDMMRPLVIQESLAPKPKP